MRRVFFLLFMFQLYKMVDSEYSTDGYKSSKISIGAMIKDPEMLRLLPNYLETKKICKHAV